jgi:hypothetical protein
MFRSASGPGHDGAAAIGVTTTTVATLVLIAMAAVLAPILSELTGKLAIPEIVFQIGWAS